MASITTRNNGIRMLQFIDVDRVRRTIHLGRVSLKIAETLKMRVEHLVSLKALKSPIDLETVKWIESISDEWAEKLAAVGLIPERRSMGLKAFLDDFRERNAGEWPSAGTRGQIEQRANNVIEAFGAARDLRTIRPADALEFKNQMLRDGLAETTVSRRVRQYRTFFAEAVKQNLLTDNPFAEVTTPEGNNQANKCYVAVADVVRVMTPLNLCWRTIIGLSRFAGLRTPSENLSLRWDGVDLRVNRMVVDSSKTGTRVVPIIEPLRPILAEAREAAPAGTVYVVFGPQADYYRSKSDTPRGWNDANLRTQFLRVIARVGVEPWPRPFHNMRASIETDLNQVFPMHVVAKWMGHSVAIAEKHYLQMRDEDLDRAAAFSFAPQQIAQQLMQQTGEAERGPMYTDESKNTAKTPENHQNAAEQGVVGFVKVTRQGFDRDEESRRDNDILQFSAARRAAPGESPFDLSRPPAFPRSSMMSSEAARLWPSLPEWLRLAAHQHAAGLNARGEREAA